MKKSILARGFIGSVASLLGVMAVGCSSEPLSPEEAAEIGVSEQALTNANVVNQSHNFVNADTDDRAAFGSACEVTDPVSPGTAKFMIALGGIESPGNTFSNDAVLYRPGVGYDANATTTFTNGRAFATVIADPSDPQACLVFGGKDGASVKGQAVKIEVGHNGSNYTLTATDVGALATPRTKLQAVAIGTKVLLMGGFTNIGETTASNLINVWDSSITGSNTIPALKNTNNVDVTLAVARGKFAAGVSEQNDRRILLGGGDDGSGPLDSIEAIILNGSDQLASTATTATNVTTTSPSARVKLSVSRGGLALVFKDDITADRETWVFGPSDGSAAIDSINVNWPNFADNTAGFNTAPVDACASTNLLAVTDPLAVKMGTDRLVFVGSTGSNKNSVMEYNAGSCTSTTTDSSSTALVSREGALGALVGGSVYYTAGRTASGGTYHQTTFKVN